MICWRLGCLFQLRVVFYCTFLNCELFLGAVLVLCSFALHCPYGLTFESPQLSPKKNAAGWFCPAPPAVASGTWTKWSCGRSLRRNTLSPSASSRNSSERCRRGHTPMGLWVHSQALAQASSLAICSKAAFKPFRSFLGPTAFTGSFQVFKCCMVQLNKGTMHHERWQQVCSKLCLTKTRTF